MTKNDVEKIVEYWKVSKELDPNNRNKLAYEHIKILASNLEKIWKINKKLCILICELEQRVEKTKNLSKTLIKACKKSYETIRIIRDDPKYHQSSIVSETLSVLCRSAEQFKKLSRNENV